MQRIILTVLSCLTLVFSAAAQTVQVPVTPTQLEYSNFVFAVTTQATNGGTAFHVTITTKTEPIQTDTAATLASVTQTNNLPAIGSINPATTVNITRTPQVWTVDFTATSDLLNNPTAYLLFVVSDYKTGGDGKRVYLPSDRMYEIRLQDFVSH